MEFSNYLMFNGDAEQAIHFYGQAIGAKVLHQQRYRESPMPVSEAWGDKIMHATLQVAGFTLMASDTREGQTITESDKMHISLNFHSQEEIDKTFAALSEGGTVTMPLQDTFWGARFGMCRDRFGVNWMFNHDKPGAQA